MASLSHNELKDRNQWSVILSILILQLLYLDYFIKYYLNNPN